MFAKTAQLVARLGLVFLHVFPYSPRPGTPAARMPQVISAVVKQRAQALRTIGQNALMAHLTAKCGQKERVLMETATTGRADDFTPLRLDDGYQATPGTLQQIAYTHVQDGILTATPS